MEPTVLQSNCRVAFHILLSGLLPEHKDPEKHGYWHPALWLTEVFWAFESPWEITSGSALEHAIGIQRTSTNQKQRPLSTALVWAGYSKHGIGSNSNRWILPGFSHTLKGYTCVPALSLKFTPSPSSAVFYFLYFPPSKYQLQQRKVGNSYKIEIQHWQMARMKQQNTFFLLY